MKTNKIKMNESQLRKMVSKIIKEALEETELDYDMDNFSGRWNRGPRYDIYIGDNVMYRNVSDEEADRLWDEVCKKAEMWGEKPRCVER